MVLVSALALAFVLVGLFVVLVGMLVLALPCSLSD